MKSGSFESERLLFREISFADAKEIVHWRSNPIINKYFSNPKPLTLKEHLEWYETIYLNDPTRIDFVVTEKERMIPIGVAGVSDLDEQSCEIRYTIGEISFNFNGFDIIVIDTYQVTDVYIADLDAPNRTLL